MNRGSGRCRIREGRVRRIRVVILLLLIYILPFVPLTGVPWSAGLEMGLHSQHNNTIHPISIQ